MRSVAILSDSTLIEARRVRGMRAYENVEAGYNCYDDQRGYDLD